MSEQGIREKLQRLCQKLDQAADRKAAPGLKGALIVPFFVVSASLASGACDDGESGGSDGTGGSGGAYGIGGNTSSWGGNVAYGMPGGWGGFGGEGGEAGGGGAGGDTGGAGGSSGGAGGN